MKLAREALKLSRPAFATISGCTVRTLENNEKGANEPGACLVAAFLATGINANWLLTGAGPMLLKSLEPVGQDLPTWAGIPDTEKFPYSRMVAMEPTRREAAVALDSSLLIRCLGACEVVYGDPFRALATSEQVGYAAAFYNLLVRVAASGDGLGGPGDIHRLEPAALADQLRLFVKMGMARMVPPPMAAGVSKLV